MFPLAVMFPAISILSEKSISPSPSGDEKALAYIVPLALMFPLAVIFPLALMCVILLILP